MSSPGGRLSVADRLFLIARDDRLDRWRLHPDAVGVGLAAGLLGELMLTHHLGVLDGELTHRLGVRDGQLCVWVSGAPPVDEVAHTVLWDIVRSPHRDVRMWLAYLAQTSAVPGVAGRLERAGLLAVVQRRVLRGLRVRYEVTDPNAAAWQAVRLRRLLVDGGLLAVDDRLLAGLVDAVGLTSYVLWDRTADAAGLAGVPAVVEGLPPSLRDLVGYTRAAVGQLVLAPH